MDGSPNLTLFQDNVVRTGTGKDIKGETGLKRGRSDSTTVAQRVPLGPGRGQVAPPVANNVHASRVPLPRIRVPAATGPKRTSRITAEQIRQEVQILEEDPQSEMEIEMEHQVQDYEREQLVNEEEVEAMIGVDDDSDAEEELENLALPPATVEPKRRRFWPELDTERAERYKQEVEAIREAFEDEVDIYDTTMVSEYSEEIFEYMSQLEVNFYLSLFGPFANCSCRRKSCPGQIIWKARMRFHGECARRW